MLGKIAIDLVIFLLEFFVFSIYRKFRSRHISLPDEEVKVPVFSESDTSLWTLMKVVWSVPYAEIHKYCGLEGKLYLALHQTLAKGFLLMAVTACVILIPIYAADDDINDDYNNLSMQHIIQQEDKMSSVLIFFLIFTVLGVMMTIVYVKHLSEAYCAEDDLSCAIDRYTVQVQGLPNGNPQLLQDSVRHIIDEEFPDHVQAVYVVPNLYKAYRAKMALKEAEHQLDRYTEYWETHSKRRKIRIKKCSKKLDAIEFYQNEVYKYQEVYERERDVGKSLCSGTAFLLCDTSISAYNLVQKFRGTTDVLDSHKWKLSIAPPPAEINWQNLRRSESSIKWQRVLIYCFYVFLFFILLTPLTMLVLVTCFLDLISLGSLLELISDAFLPSIVLLLYLSAILRHSVLSLVHKEKLTSKSEETVSAMKKYLLVMFTYTFLVPLLAIQSLTTFWITLEDDTDQEFGSDPSETGLYFFFVVIHLAFLKNAGDFFQLPSTSESKSAN